MIHNLGQRGLRNIDSSRHHRLWNTGSHRKNMVSLLYPLAVSNLVIAAMNLAAEIGVPQVNADVVKGV
ncbi:hypothetical protein [Escherichia coli]|uniref:hypothetical protein n=1 Tax=Escherichia coli TaxID=562 RepID=UPI000DEC83A2